MQINRDSILSRVVSYSILLTWITLTFLGCGGGSSSSTPPVPNFTLVANPQTLTIGPGGSSVVQITVQPSDGFASSVTVMVSGLPSGVTVMPSSSFSVTPSSGQSLTFVADPSVALGTYQVGLSGTSSSIQHSVQVTLQVSGFATFAFSPSHQQYAISPSGSAVIDFSDTVSGANTNYTLQLSVSGLPSGITATFPQNPISPTAPSITLNLSASSGAPIVQNGTVAVTATRTADGVQSIASFLLSVAPPPGQLANNRSDFVRTDGLMRDGAYDPVHQLLFVSNWSWNRVDVISTVSDTLVTSVPVPNPWGVDLSLDGSKVLVGTATLQVFTIDTSTLQVVQRNVLPNLLPTFSNPTTTFPRQMANGNVLILAEDNGSTASALLKWTPSTNAVTVVPLPPTFQAAAIARSIDGSRALIVSNVLPSPGMIYDSATDSFTISQNLANATFPIAMSPNGSRFAVVNANSGFMEYDSNANPIGAIPCGPVCGPLTGIVYSPDGSRLYLIVDSATPNIVTVDAGTLALL